MINGPSGPIEIISLDKFINGIPLKKINHVTLHENIATPIVTSVTFGTNTSVDLKTYETRNHTLTPFFKNKLDKYMIIDPFFLEHMTFYKKKDEFLTLITKEHFNKINNNLNIETIIDLDYKYLEKLNYTSNAVLVDCVLNENQKFCVLTSYDNWIFYYNEERSIDNIIIKGKLIYTTLELPIVTLRYRENKLYEEFAKQRIY